MRKAVLLFLILAAGVAGINKAKAQNPGFEWSRNYGGVNHDVAVRALAHDTSGNLYFSGTFLDSTTIGQHTVTASSPDYNGHITKLDSAGNVLWVKPVLSTGMVIINDIKTDAQGNIYTVGMYSGTLSIGSISVAPSFSMNVSHAFIAKLNSSGQELWIRKSDSPTQMMIQSASTVALDNAGNAYLIGTFSDTTTFGNLTLFGVGNTNNSWFMYHDTFVVKYNSNGTEQWGITVGEPDTDILAQAGETDNTGTLYITGRFGSWQTQTVHIGSTSLTSRGEHDIFLFSVTPAGAIQWAKRGGGPGIDWVLDLDIDAQNNLYLTGSVADSANFDSDTLTTTAQSTSFLASYLPSGNLRWARQATGSASMGMGLGLDNFGNCFVTGSFGGNQTLGDSVSFGNNTLISTGWYDGYVVKYTSSGNVEWATASAADGMYSGIAGYAVVADGSGMCYVLGDFYNTVSLGLDSLVSSGPSYERDIFLTKIGKGPFLRTAAPGFTQTTQGAAVQISYRTDGAFDAGNIFTAELSDASGSFAAPVVIGSVASSAAGQIAAVIPANTPIGDHYRIRVTASAPAKIAPDNGTDLKIGQMLSAPQVQPQNSPQVFPNPFSDGFTLTGNLTEEPMELQLIDGLGRVVSCQKHATHLAGSAIEVKTTHLPDGLYLLRLIQGKTVHHATVVKQ